MKVNTEDLKTAHDVISHVPISDVLESSQYVRLRQNGADLTLSATGTLWAEAQIKGAVAGGKWISYVERRILKTFLSTAKESETEMFFKDNKLTLKSGQRFEVAQHAPISGYQTWNPKNAFDLTPEQLVVLKTGVQYLPIIVGNANFEAVYFGKGYGILASDRLSIMACTGSSIPLDFFVPAPIARFLATNGGKLALDDTGIGVSQGNGFVYQPLNAELDNFPKDALKSRVEDARKQPACAVFRADALSEALSVAGQFLSDKKDSAAIVGSKNSIQISIDLPTGKFQRPVSSVKECAIPDDVTWPVKRLLPWLGMAAAKKDCELEYAKWTGASAFRFADGKQKHILIFADL